MLSENTVSGIQCNFPQSTEKTLTNGLLKKK